MALVLCTGVDPSVVHTRHLILERAGHVVISALDEPSLIAACEHNKFEVAVVGQSVSAKSKRRIARLVRENCPTPNCWNSITYPPARSLKTRMHGWKCWQMCHKSLRCRLRRLPLDERPLQAVRYRPATIPIVAAFLFFATGIAFVVGVSLLFPNRLLDLMWKLNPEGAILFRSIGPVSGVFLLALGVGTFFAALGLLRGQRWAWWFAVFLFGIDSCGNAVSYFLTHDALRSGVGAIISATFLFFLCRHSVRNYFLRQALTPNHKP